jgi:hypothetical protein
VAGIVEHQRNRPVVAAAGLAVAAGVEAFVILMFDLAGMWIGNQCQLSAAQRLADQDVVEQQRVIFRGLLCYFVAELGAPAQMLGVVEQGVIEEPLGEQDLALEVADQIEEQVLPFE